MRKASKTLSDQEGKVTEPGKNTASGDSSRDKDQRSSTLEKKEELRRKLLEKRRSLSESVRRKKSRSILNKLLSEKAFINSDRVALYFPIDGEVDTLEIFKKCIDLEKKVFLPKTQGSRLVFLRTKNLEELVSGPFNIPEPASHVERAEELDLILVPGIGFDFSGNRIGYGKGFYDRFLKDVSRRISFALAYRFQVLESVPAFKTDVRAGHIITEEGIIDCLENQGD